MLSLAEELSVQTKHDKILPTKFYTLSLSHLNTTYSLLPCKGSVMLCCANAACVMAEDSILMRCLELNTTEIR